MMLISKWNFYFCLITYLLVLTVFGLEPRGPVFIIEPPHHVDFSNSTGSRIDCAVHGNPSPVLKWTTVDGTSVNNITSIRIQLNNGSLHFLPFEAKDYRQEVHATSYRCQASNSFGVIISRDVITRAVVQQIYEVQVYDEYAISGNTAVLNCHIPSFVTEYVAVISWTQEFVIDGNYTGINLDNRYSMMSTGELHIRDVTADDAIHEYRCHTRNRLTGEIRESSTAGRLVVTEPRGSVQPRITNSQSAIYAKQNDVIVLPCVAQGYPLPIYSWFIKVSKDQSVPLTYSDRIRRLGGSVVIQSTQLSDAATYICAVTNSVGVEKVEISLYVTVPMAAYVQPQQQVIDLGKSAHFNCIVTGHPVNSVIWLKNGQQLQIDNRIRLIGRDSIIIDEVRREDRGIYQCHARNDIEYVQGSSELRLGDASPEISEHFSTQVIHVGSSVSLECLVTGNPPPKVTWFVDDQRVTDSRLSLTELIQSNGDVIARLNITHSKTEDGGLYKCLARNRGGSASHSARLNVHGGPFIRFMPKVTVIAKDTMTITCPYAGYPIENIGWEKDGINLPVNHRQTVHLNGTLVVHSVERKSDTGTYSCVVRNQHNGIARRDVQVIVMVPPLLTPISFQDGQLYEGARARITCGVTGGDLPINFRWQKDFRDIPDDLAIAIRDIDEYSNILIIGSVTPQHSGNYTCIASNAASSTNHTAPLTVNVPPRWILEPLDTEAMIGDDKAINCQAFGIPTPFVIWKKAVGDAPTSYQTIEYDGLHYRMNDNGSLHIDNIIESDSGYYLCHVSNNIGTGLSKVIHLKIQVGARFAIKNRNTTIARGQTAHLVCDAIGDNPIRLNWFINKKNMLLQGRPRYKLQERKVKNGRVSELTIAHAQREDSATFDCSADNIYGRDQTTIQLVVQEPPESPTNVRIVEQNSRSVQVAWIPPYGGNSPIEKYIIQYKLVSDSWNNHSINVTITGSQTTATIVNLVPAKSYNLRVIAANSVGTSGQSNTLTITSAEEAPSGQPRNVKLHALSSSALKVTWDPPNKSDWHGNIQGYYIGYKLHDVIEPYTFKSVPPATDDDRPKIGPKDDYKLELQLDNLKKNNKYGVVIQAFNRLGSGPKSDEVVIMTMEDVPDQAPFSLLCSSLSSQSLLVVWDPPPPQSINGNLKGYKVHYTHTDYGGLDSQPEVKMTTATKTILHGLAKYSNYSIQILPFTAIGDGPFSDVIYCNTAEDAPEAPSDIKAVVMSNDVIIVSWKAPTQPNGIIVKYTVYVRGNLNINEETSKHIVTAGKENYFQVTNLSSNRRYDFWVTASTSVGEGKSTRVVSQMTGSKIPARIISLSDHLITASKSELRMQCKTVGIPPPFIEWNFVSKTSKKLNLQADKRMRISDDGSLTIDPVSNSDNGNFTCIVKNLHGSDVIFYNVTVLAPPGSPSIYVTSVNLTKIDLKWKAGSDHGLPIKGYNLNYKADYSEWVEVTVDGRSDNFSLTELWCGTRYQIYIVAFNKIGTGEPSSILSTKTKGYAPEIPPKHILIQENATSVLLKLDTWQSGGCPVLYFVVQYRPASYAHEWILVANNVRPSQVELIISDLRPQTSYDLLVTAHNSAGSTVAEYNFYTRTIAGGTIAPVIVLRDQHHATSENFTVDFRAIASVGISIFVIVAALAIVCFCVRQQNTRHRPREKVEEVGNFPNSTKCYTEALPTHNNKNNFTVLMTEQPMTNRKFSASTPTDNVEKSNSQDVCPYATFPITPGHRDSQLGLTHVTPYNHHNHVSNYNVPAIKYNNNQQINRQSSNLQLRKEQYSSQLSESDLSELTTSPLVRPFIQLPVVNNTRQSITNQLEQRVPDLLYHKPESSSEETSPEVDRRIYQRPGRTRHSNKSLHSHPEISDSQDSNSEDNAFSYDERKRDPAVLYSDGGLEFSEAECDRDRRYKYIQELKGRPKHYNLTYRDNEDSNLLVRRFQENMDSGFYSDRNTSEEFTIAV